MPLKTNSGSNPSPPNQKIILKTLLSTISEGSSAFLFLFGVLIARTLGPSGYGEFTYALAYCAIFVLLIDSGLGEMLSRDFSYDNEQGRRALRAGIGVQTILAPVIVIALIASTYLFQQEITSQFVIFNALVASICRAFKSSLRGLLRGSSRFDVESVSMTAERISLAILGMVAFTTEWGLVTVIMAFAILKVIDFLSLALYTHFKISPLLPIFEYTEMKWLVLRMIPFSFTMAIWLLYNYTDLMMLGYFRDSDEVGQYGAIYQCFEGMIIIPSIIGAVFLPWMSYEFRTNKDGVAVALKKGIRILIAASIPVVCISLYAPEEIIILLFGKDFLNAALGLSLLLGAAPFVFIFWFFRGGLVAIHKTDKLLAISVIGVVFNIVANLFAIPKYGLYGACGTTLLTEVLTYVMAYNVLKLNGIIGAGIAPWIKSILAGAFMLIPMLVSEHFLGWALPGVPLGLIFMHFLLCRMGFWEADERETLRRLRLDW